MPLTYRSQRPLADAAPLRRHKAQVIGSGATGGQFLGIDRMHFPPGGVRLEAVDFVAVVEAGTNAVKVCGMYGWFCGGGGGGVQGNARPIVAPSAAQISRSFG